MSENLDSNQAYSDQSAWARTRHSNAFLGGFSLFEYFIDILPVSAQANLIGNPEVLQVS